MPDRRVRQALVQAAQRRRPVRHRCPLPARPEQLAATHPPPVNPKRIALRRTGEGAPRLTAPRPGREHVQAVHHRVRRDEGARRAGRERERGLSRRQHLPKTWPLTTDPDTSWNILRTPENTTDVSTLYG